MTGPGKFVDLVFTAFPGPGDECVFVETEYETGHGISLGEWVKRDDGYAVLRIPDPRIVSDLLAACEALIRERFRGEASAEVGKAAIDAIAKAKGGAQ